MIDKEYFDWKFYVTHYNDLKHIKNKQDAWKHYLHHGYDENRVINKSQTLDNVYKKLFDWKYYVNKYNDISSSINDEESAWEHYRNRGYKEGRECCQNLIIPFPKKELLENNQNQESKILVVMPTYNRSANIKKIIKMMKAQVYTNFVFLIIDDGSENEHKQTFYKLKEKYQWTKKLIFMENHVNSYIAKTLNKGIQYFLDNKEFTHFTWISDDNVYYPCFLSELIINNSFFNYTSFHIQEINGVICTNNTKYKDYNDILNNFNGCASFMWTRDAIKKIGFYEENIHGCEDFEYLLRTFKLNETDCKFLPISTMKYVRHDKSFMENNREKIMELKNKIIDKYKKNKNKNKYNFSIVMAYYNRKPQTLETLKGFERMYAGKYSFEVIIVDDNSNYENRLEEDIKQFSFDIKLVVISAKEKGSRINSCVPYNIGFKEAKGKVILIQNPECLHIGNILEYIKLKFKHDSYLSFPCYNSNNYNVNDYIKTNITNININNIEQLTKQFNKDPKYGEFPIWYQHPEINNENLHFCTAIYAEYLQILGGFDESYKNGVCFEDNAFIFDIKEKLKLNIIPIGLEEQVGVVHQYHGRSAGCNISYSETNLKQNAIFEKFTLNKNIFELNKNNNKSFSAPKIIHYYWDNFEKFSYMNLYSLKSSVYYNPDFIHIIWVPINPQEKITWSEFCNKDFNQDSKWKEYLNDIKKIKNVRIINKNIIKFLNVDDEMSEIHKSDLFRYKILNKYGGVWSDLDIVYIKSITEIINFDFDTINFFVSYYSTNIVIPIGFLVSVRDSPLFNLIYNKAIDSYDKNRYQCMGAECLGNIFLNKVLNNDNLNNLIHSNSFKYLDNGYLLYNNNDNKKNIIMNNLFYMNFLWNEIEDLFVEYKNNKNLLNTVGFHWFNGSNITKKYLKEIIDYTIPDKFNGIVFSEKYKFHLNVKIVTYFYVENIKWSEFLNKYTENYINIINVKYSNIKIRKISLNYYCSTHEINNFLVLLNNCNDSLVIFNELLFAHMLYNYNHGSQSIKKIIKTIFSELNYVIFFTEVMENDNLKTIGNPTENKEFCQFFFKNAIHIYICNTRNINYLIKNNIYENILYHPPICYSIINNFVPLLPNKIQEIDILFYGNVIDTFTYRINAINHVNNFSKLNNYNFLVEQYLHDESKINTLKNTKIVIHIPSHEKLHTFPWAKVGELMSNKIFFIIEENEEMYIKNLDKIVIYYEQNNMIDLVKKIKYYLDNESERHSVTENCFKYIKDNYNMDTLFDNII